MIHRLVCRWMKLGFYKFICRRAAVTLKEYGRRAKLPEGKCHFHVLKHYIVTHLPDTGEADIQFVQYWLRHRNVQNTILYASLISTIRGEKQRTFL
jgi:site-specific recombinase XerD